MTTVSFGSDELQDMVPLAGPRSSVLDPGVRIGNPPPTRKQAESMFGGGGGRTANPRRRAGMLRKKAFGPRIEELDETRDDGDVDTNDDRFDEEVRGSRRRGSHRQSGGDTRRDRMYRPSSPVDSINSDLDMLANKDKLKETLAEPSPADRLAEDVIPTRSDKHRGGRGSRSDRHHDDGGFDDDLDGDAGDFDDGFDDDRNSVDSYLSGGSMGSQYSGDSLGSRGSRGSRRSGHGSSSKKEPKLTYEQTMDKKASILADLERRQSNGEKVSFDESMTLEQLALIKSKCIHKNRGTQMIKLMRQAITLYAGLLEWTSKKVPALNLDLTDFGKDMFAKKNDYDDLLMEIYELHGDDMKMHPAAMLLLTITGQAMMYSAARNFVKNAQFGMGVPPPPPPPPAMMAAPGQQQGAGAAVGHVPADQGIVDVDISGPTGGFDQAELLELCRKEAQTKQQQQQPVQHANQPQEVTFAVQQQQQQPQDNNAPIQVELPQQNDSGVQIVRGAGARRARSGGNTKSRAAAAATPVEFEVQPSAAAEAVPLIPDHGAESSQAW